MPKKEQPEFIILTPDNIEEIARELESGNGVILMADPEYYGSPSDLMSGRFRMHLFDRPIIDAKNDWIKVHRGSKKVRGEDWQTGWEQDREYSLRKKDRLIEKNGGDKSADREELWNIASDLFEELSIGDFEFSIGFQASVGSTLHCEKDSRVQTYYIPRSASRDAAFTHALTWMLDLWNAQKPPEGWPVQFTFTKEHVEAMVRYALEDLKTGKVFAHNVQAGMDADVLMGVG
jgi:hypothetical protein